MGRNWRNICFLIFYYCGVKKAIPQDVLEIWIQMYMLMYMKMDCKWFKHGVCLVKFFNFLAMYKYIFRYCGCVGFRRPYCRTNHNDGKWTNLVQEGCPVIELSILFWKYKHKWNSFRDTYSINVWSKWNLILAQTNIQLQSLFLHCLWCKSPQVGFGI